MEPELIFLEATFEAIADKGKKTLAGVIEFASIGIWLILLILASKGILRASDELSIFGLILSYILLRYALFDLIYNNWRGLPVCYIGKTKVSDKVLIWILYKSWFGRKFKPMQEHFLVVTKVISLCIVTGILIFN